MGPPPRRAAPQPPTRLSARTRPPQVAESNPLRLFRVTGTNRTDVVYNPEAGQLYIVAYPMQTANLSSVGVT